MARNVLSIHAMIREMTLRNGLVSWLAALLALAGCSSSGSDSTMTSDAPRGSPARIVQAQVARDPIAAVPASALSAAVAANNAFAVDLFAHVRADVTSANVLTSPISASLALTMAYAGAVGQTRTEMATALHLGLSADGAIFAGQNALSQALNGRAAAALAQAQANAQTSRAAAPSADDYQLQTINSVWGQTTYTWQPAFLDTLAKNYGTGVYQEDFVHDYEPSRNTINDWVSAETKDKIKDLLPFGSLDDQTRMVLVNAIHIKFPWATAFEASATAPATFTRQGGASVTADFMNMTNYLGYGDDGQAQIVSLPMGYGDLTVVLALPHEGIDLASYEATLSESSAPLLVPTASELIQLSLPKASFTSPSFSLAQALKAMGMNLAFDLERADLSGLCAAPPDGLQLYLSDVLQKATISMVETGAEAAAATAVVVRGTISIAPEPPAMPTPMPMIVNRPYLVEVVDKPTGAVLMLGHIKDPTDAGSQ